jgi:flagellar protein FliS
MQTSATRGYQVANVTTVDRVRVVVLCYEGCIANLARAQEEMRDGHPSQKGVYLGKALAIVTELMNSLDREQGGEIAERLELLYRYVIDTLSQANMKQDPNLLDGPIRVLKELKEGWSALAAKGGEY